MSKPDTMLGDADIRPALRSHLLGINAHETDTVILEELGICRGQVRVDLAVVNGLLHGYEIKSDRDNLGRLHTQADFYGRVLDRATLVVGKRHLSEAIGVVPVWWEILQIESSSQNLWFKIVRHGRSNPSRKSRALVELLWLDDAIALLEQCNAVRGIRGKPRRIVWDRLCEHFNIDEIATAVRGNLKARSGNLSVP